MNDLVRILLVEDNPGDADLTRDTLESGRLNAEISLVIDGEQAVAYMSRKHPYENVERPDLVLLDLNLPKKNGQEVLAEIKRHASLCSIPVVILTSSDAERDIVNSYQLGANCYVTKPVGLDAYQAVVRAVEDFWFSVAKLP
jgi:DNA-binding response OmpR family regulator